MTCVTTTAKKVRMKGKPVLPIESAQLEQLVSVGITTVASLVAWWKNNSFTQEALAADVEYERQRKLNGK